MSRLPEIVKVAADPAAGGEILFTADEDMIVHSVYFSLTTSAVVANRTVMLLADDGTSTFFKSQASSSQAAGLTFNYCAFEGAPASGLNVALPSGGLRLRKGDRLLTSTLSKDAGDDYGVMRLQIERI